MLNMVLITLQPVLLNVFDIRLILYSSTADTNWCRLNIAHDFSNLYKIYRLHYRFSGLVFFFFFLQLKYMQLIISKNTVCKYCASLPN